MKVRMTKTIGDEDGKKAIDYSGWGDFAANAEMQGWYPETTYNGETVWRSNYSPAFNDVYNPKTPNIRGHLAIIQRPDKKFDVAIRDNQYRILQKPLEGASPQLIQDYLTNAQSTVAQRNNRVVSNTPSLVMLSK